MKVRLRGGPHDGREVDVDPPPPGALAIATDTTSHVYVLDREGDDAYRYEGRQP